MFQDPFEPFHEIAAQAKEEREQLNRLPTVASPGQRLLAATCGLTLFALAGWLLLGSVSPSVSLDGVLVGAAGNPAAANGTAQAMVRLEPDLAQRLAPGMQLAVELATAGGEKSRVTGEISSLTALADADGARARIAAAPAATHRLGISLDDSAGGGAADGSECRIVIRLGEFSPASLMGFGRV